MSLIKVCIMRTYYIPDIINVWLVLSGYYPLPPPPLWLVYRRDDRKK